MNFAERKITLNKYNQILNLLQNLSDEQIEILLKNHNINLESNQNNKINIENLLKELCVNPSLLGFNYLKRGIEICIEEPKMLSGITKELYPTISKEYNTTSSRVERAIRHAIETSWGKINGETYQEVFYNELEKPTNSAYIAYVCSYINNIKSSINKQQNQKLYK